jgi:hypothetical protein
MVDFKKRLAGRKVGKEVDSVRLYATLDRAHDKGPLRPSQLSVLDDSTPPAWEATRYLED